MVLAIAASAVVLALALAAKTWRYAARTPEPAANIASAIERRMLADGWSATAVGAVDGGELGVPVLAFEKTGCEAVTTIAVIGRQTELAPFVRITLGQSVVLVRIPATRGDAATARTTAFGRLLAPLAEPEPHLLAIAPDPADAPPDCAPRLGTAWPS
jgi:hypothetical protein